MGLFERAMNAFRDTESGQKAPAKKPGRNESCWCGSGKKYKKCHLHEDDAKAGARVCSPNCGPT